MEASRNRSFVSRTALAIQVSLVVASALSGAWATAQASPQFMKDRVVLRVKADEALKGRWEIVEAMLSENFEVTWADLVVRNTSTTPQRFARFYAEYIDVLGNRCFTIAFGDHDQVAPGETRRISVSTPGLAPGSEPAEVQVREVLATASPSELAPFVRVPPTVAYSEASKVENLPTRLVPPDMAPVHTLVAALVDVSEDGNVVSTKVLPSEADPWLIDFIRHLRFRPARTGSKPIRSTSVVLVRLVKGYSDGQTVPALLAREDALVQRLVSVRSGVTTDQPVPVVNELRFEPSAYWGEAPEGSASWMWVSISPDWCLESLSWASAGKEQIRQWRDANTSGLKR